MRKLLAAALLLTVTFTASAQKKNDDDFRLTMDNIKASAAALVGLGELFKKDPALKQRFEALKEELPDTNGRDSVSMTAEAMLKREPAIAAVYRKAGISPKVAGDTMETLIGCAFGEAMLASAGSNAKLPEGFVAENVEFYRQHKAEITHILSELKKLKVDDDDKSEDDDMSEDNDR